MITTPSKIRPHLEAAFADCEGQPLEVMIGIQISSDKECGISGAVNEPSPKRVQGILDYFVAQGYDLDFIMIGDGDYLYSGQRISYAVVKELAERDDVVYIECIGPKEK